MFLDLTWTDIALRLALTVVAGGVIGLNREATGHEAGLRTTMIVCLAASVSMIQANLLLGVSGKTPQLFSEMDVLRLPLGILTGVGFIGGGAILRRGDLVTGVTTAATLWLVTVVGLCLGGGQLGVGVAATVITVVILSAVSRVDAILPHRRHATLVLTTAGAPLPESRLQEVLQGFGCHVRPRELRSSAARTVTSYRVDWRHRKDGPPVPLAELRTLLGEVEEVEWLPRRRE
jgi:putative Mg2+ transporter-C (MgtC) family protein